jgi:Transposase DDE domain
MWGLKKKGGSFLSADLGKMVVTKPTIHQSLRKEPPVLIMHDALPLFKSFLKPVSLNQRARQLVLRCVIAFLMHLGKMSASRVAGAIRTDSRHRAQISRFMGRRFWRRCDILGQLRTQVLELEARQGVFTLDIDQTYCSQQGKLTENRIIRGEKTKRPKKNKQKQKKYAQRSCHCFVMALLITPSGIRLPFSLSYYTKACCEARKIAHRKQTELAAQLIRELPLPPEARVVVLGDTAFDAEAIRAACDERKFSWIVPINPERVLAGAKPRTKVSSLSEDLTADQMVRLEVHPGKGKYVEYRRTSRYRIGPKIKPRTYYVHEESRDVYSVGKTRLFFSTTKAPAQGCRVEVQKILMTNDEKLTLRDVIELYQLRWQIELFFKELKSNLGLHHYRFKEFDKVETWVTLCLVTFVYLEWIRARKLKQKSLTKKEREWWQAQRTYGLAQAVRQEAEQRELELLADKIESPIERKALAEQLRQSHPAEYRMAI